MGIISEMQIAAYQLPFAAGGSITHMLENLGKSSSNIEQAVVDILMGALALLGIFFIFKAFKAIGSRQPSGMLWFAGAGSLLAAGIIYGKFKSINDNINKHAGGAAESMLNGQG